MPISVKDMVAVASAAVPNVDPATAQAMIAKGNVLLLDVREPAEVAASGLAEGAVNVPRGLLEFRADPESPMHDPVFDRDKTVLLYCAAGGRAALAGKVLKDMGYMDVHNLGGFKDWADAGGPVTKGD